MRYASTRPSLRDCGTEDGLAGEVYNGDNRHGGPEIVRLIREELALLVKRHDVPG